MSENQEQDNSVLDKDSLLATIMKMGYSYEEASEVPNLIDMGFTSSQIEKAAIEAGTTNLDVLVDHMTQQGI